MRVANHHPADAQVGDHAGHHEETETVGKIIVLRFNVLLVPFCDIADEKRKKRRMRV